MSSYDEKEIYILDRGKGNLKSDLKHWRSLLPQDTWDILSPPHRTDYWQLDKGPTELVYQLFND